MLVKYRSTPPRHFEHTLPQVIISPCRIKAERDLLLRRIHAVDGELASIHTAAHRDARPGRYQRPAQQGKGGEQEHPILKPCQEPLSGVLLPALLASPGRKKSDPVSEFFYVSFHICNHPCGLLLQFMTGKFDHMSPVSAYLLHPPRFSFTGRYSHQLPQAGQDLWKLMGCETQCLSIVRHKPGITPSPFILTLYPESDIVLIRMKTFFTVIGIGS